MVYGRLNYFRWRKLRFHGAFSTYEDAVAYAKRKNISVGFNHDKVANIHFDIMSQVVPWDYPVLFWLEKLLPDTKSIIDLGGHMGTKYRAFKPYLKFDINHHRWIIYDLPAIIAAGRKQAIADGLNELVFIDHINIDETHDIAIASGLLQYLDIPLSILISHFPVPPKHLILNKVAMRDGDNVVTIENIEVSLNPYQIRNRKLFIDELLGIGYEIVDEWEIPSLSHMIPTHPELGRSKSFGFYCKLNDK
jgi:putative methyltransferase (TIGR04325 family)